PPREGELAAAWRNWKQIRETLVESQPTSEVAEAPAVEATSQTQEEVASPAPSGPAQAAAAEAVAEVEAAASEVAEESTAIASIVDTMLAELRPKLVAEIAK